MNKLIIISVIVMTSLVQGCSTTTPKSDPVSQDNPVTPAADTKEEDNGNTAEIDSSSTSHSNTQYIPPASIQTGRYTVLTPSPTHEQTHILDVIIHVTLPEEDLATVGQAIRYLLKRSGYQLVQPSRLSPDVRSLFAKPIPRIHRQLGPMPLRDALNTLATPAFRLIDDPVHRVISFQRIALAEE
jgi:type IV pili sensor histidine kinase/response regulator